MSARSWSVRTRLATVALLLLLSSLTCADEGLWPLDNLPLQTLDKVYDFQPSQDWLDSLRLASLRLSGGCSASFVSADGLVLSNHHCLSRCIAQISGPEHNLLKTGFVAKTRDDEAICPAAELNQLLQISDVTDSIQAASDDLSPSQAHSARQAAIESLESRCRESAPQLRCEVVSLYHGARFQLYKYRRFQDVRLAFAPETAMSRFGGNQDSFNFPRYALDMSLMRVYVDGKPFQPEHYFQLDEQGPSADELLFVSGHPGTTQRDLSVEELRSLRDVVLPQRLTYLEALHALLGEFASANPQRQHISQREYLSVENTLKAFRGQHAALNETGFLQTRLEQEQRLQRRIRNDRELNQLTKGSWQAIADSQQLWRSIFTEYALLEWLHGYQSDLFSIARHLLRVAEQKQLPDAQRLPEYREAALPKLTQRLFSAAPIHPELEVLTLTWSLELLRELLGSEHPLVKLSLGEKSPEELAHELIRETILGDLVQRKALWDGGLDAIEASNDPLLLYARMLEPQARKLRKTYEKDVAAALDINKKRIREARFRLNGTSNYPEASYSLRLGYGQLQGWQRGDQAISPVSTIAGALARATGHPPFALPTSWVEKIDQLPLATTMNFTTDHDIIAGYSGGPVLNRQGGLVGLIFDGNTHSLSARYAYNPESSRAIALHPASIKVALELVYMVPELVRELFPSKHD